MRRRLIGLAVSLLVLVAIRAAPARAEEKALPRLRPSGIDGALVICGGEAPEAARVRFVRLAGDDEARLVILSSDDNADGETTEKRLESWKARKPASVVALAVRSRKMADDVEILKPLRKATGVWVDGGVFPETELEKELRVLLQRGALSGASRCRRG